MAANEIAAFLIKNCGSLNAFDSYMFGSTLAGIGHDIDILVIGSSGEELFVLKQEFMVVGRELPLDVLYMQPSEAVETDFVNREGCIELSVLASRSYNVGKDKNK
jgi:hypothetical protein